jgi:hypothetical protein
MMEGGWSRFARLRRVSQDWVAVLQSLSEIFSATVQNEPPNPVNLSATKFRA